MRRRRLAALAGLLLLSACAWTRRENRPVWNAFEATMVPEPGGAYYAMLPVNVVVGLGAILVDTFIAHPLQVVDDAWEDTRELWRGIDFAAEYYTESALLPVRAVASPVWLVGSFLGRSMFDWPSVEEAARRRDAAQQRQRRDTMQWLETVARGEAVSNSARLREPFDTELVAAVRAALQGGDADARMRLYRAVAACSQPDLIDWNAALSDPSAVVRFEVVRRVPRDFELSAAARRQVLDDSDEAVRLRAAQRWNR